MKVSQTVALCFGLAHAASVAHGENGDYFDREKAEDNSVDNSVAETGENLTDLPEDIGFPSSASGSSANTPRPNESITGTTDPDSSRAGSSANTPRPNESITGTTDPDSSRDSLRQDFIGNARRRFAITAIRASGESFEQRKADLDAQWDVAESAQLAAERSEKFAKEVQDHKEQMKSFIRALRPAVEFLLSKEKIRVVDYLEGTLEDISMAAEQIERAQSTASTRSTRFLSSTLNLDTQKADEYRKFLDEMRLDAPHRENILSKEFLSTAVNLERVQEELTQRGLRLSELEARRDALEEDEKFDEDAWAATASKVAAKREEDKRRLAEMSRRIAALYEEMNVVRGGLYNDALYDTEYLVHAAGIENSLPTSPVLGLVPVGETMTLAPLPLGFNSLRPGGCSEPNGGVNADAGQSSASGSVEGEAAQSTMMPVMGGGGAQSNQACDVMGATTTFSAEKEEELAKLRAELTVMNDKVDEASASQKAVADELAKLKRHKVEGEDQKLELEIDITKDAVTERHRLKKHHKSSRFDKTAAISGDTHTKHFGEQGSADKPPYQQRLCAEFDERYSPEKDAEANGQEVWAGMRRCERRCDPLSCRAAPYLSDIVEPAWQSLLNDIAAKEEEAKAAGVALSELVKARNDVGKQILALEREKVDMARNNDLLTHVKRNEEEAAVVAEFHRLQRDGYERTGELAR